MVLLTPLRCLPASNPITLWYSSSFSVGIGEPSKSMPAAIAVSMASAPVVVSKLEFMSPMIKIQKKIKINPNFTVLCDPHV